MYVYQLTYRDEGNLLPIGYFGSHNACGKMLQE